MKIRRLNHFQTRILKILNGGRFVAKGALFGLGINLVWHYFLADGLGWGETAPDWYFKIQVPVFLALFFLGLVGWILFYSRRERYFSLFGLKKIHFSPAGNKVFPLFIISFQRNKLVTKIRE
jgi:hypothetical protein